MREKYEMVGALRLEPCVRGLRGKEQKLTWLLYLDTGGCCFLQCYCAAVSSLFFLELERLLP